MFGSVWGRLRSAWVGGCCDPEQSMWFLGWTPYALSHGLNPFFTDHLNYPFGVNLMWNSAMHVPSALSAPAQALVGPIAAYNLVIIGGIGLSAWTAYLAARRFCDGHFGPLVCGLLYGFSPYMLPQALQHLPLVLVPLPPLLLLVLHEATVRQRWSPYVAGAALGLIGVAQLLTDEEVLASMAIVAAVGLLLLAWLGRRGIRARAPYVLRVMGTGLGTFLLLAAVPLWTQLFGPLRPHGDLQSPDVFVTDLLNFVLPTDRQLIQPPEAAALAQGFSGMGHEQNGYIGIPLLVLLALLTFRLRKDLTSRFLLVMSAATAVLSLGPHLHVAGHLTPVPMPWLPIGSLPLVRNILPGRLMLFTFLFAGLILARYADGEITIGGRRRGAVAAGTVLLTLVPLLPAWPFPVSTGQNPGFFFAGAPSLRDGSVVLVAPFIRDGGDADPMLWAAETGDRIRMPQGYFYIPGPDGSPFYGALPSPLVAMMETIQETGRGVDYEGPARRQLADDMRRRRVATITVGPMQHQELMVQVFAALLRRPPDEHVGDVYVWRDVGDRGVPTDPPP
jgi:hypothetical protein